ncbi:MAG: hypothetical protein AAGG44_12495 [Planctomycetota bacterium]
MHRFRLASLWPGLAAAWYRGQVRGLLVAILFAWAFCGLLLCTFIWPAWVPGWMLACVWLAIGVFWLYEAVRCQFVISTLIEDVSPNTENEFAAAQAEYLQGRWFEAEARLLTITQDYPHDVTAALLLIGVLRRTKRLRPALRKLEQLSLLEAALPWQFEINREKQLLDSALEEKRESEAEASETDEDVAHSGASEKNLLLGA